jgi:hypothetical protein
MAEMRQAGGKGGAVVEDELLLSFPLGHGLFKNTVLFPKGQDFFFQLGKVYLRIYRFVHDNASKK